MPLAWVPYADRAEAERRLNGIPAGLELDFYRADGDELPGSIDEVAFYVLPYMKGPAVLERAADMPKLQVVQTLTAGYEEFLPLVPPGVTLCNAAGLHDTSTAELAVALALASGRHLDEFARNQPSGTWRFAFGRALADQRVLIIGYGHIGQAIEHARQEKLIGNTLEARVILNSDSDVTDRIPKEELEEFFILSDLTIHRADEPSASVTKTPYKKCARCWRHRPTVGTSKTHPDLCDRCESVVAAMTKSK